MLITFQNAKGGPELHKFPLCEENGVMGYKVGYCSNCNNQLLFRTIDMGKILAYFKFSEDEYLHIRTQFHRRPSLKEKVIHLLGGEILEK